MNREMMRDSGVKWIGEVPKTWKIDRLKDIADVNENSLEANTPDNYILKYIEISNVNSRGIISEKAIEEIEFASAPSRARRKVAYGDTIISSVRPNLQAIAYIEIDEPNLVCSTGFYVVVPKQPYLIKQRFLYFCLLSENSKQYFESVAKGVGYPAVDDKEFKAIKLALPTLAEQQAIAHYLNQRCGKLDTIIAIKQQQIKTLDALRQSIIYQAVTKGLDTSASLVDSGVEWLGKIPKGWRVESLKRLLDEPLKYGANEAAELDDRSLPRYIRITDFDHGGCLKEDSFKSLPIDKAEGYYLKHGDVLFARSGATVGKTFIFYGKDKEACFAGYLIKASTNRYLLSPDFLYFYTKSPAYDLWKNSIFTQATIQNIGADKYAYLPVIVPPLSEQERIVNYLDQETQRLDQLKTNLNQQISTLEAYKKSLIYECVTGKKRIALDHSSDEIALA